MYSKVKKSYRLTLFCLVASSLLVNETGSSSLGRPYALAQKATDASSKNRNGVAAFPVTFVDVAGPAGLTEPIIYGGLEQKKYIIETNGSGVAFLDYDNDGWVDILLPNGTRLEGFPKGKEPTIRLYRNQRNGSFTDVT